MAFVSEGEWALRARWAGRTREALHCPAIRLAKQQGQQQVGTRQLVELILSVGPQQASDLLVQHTLMRRCTAWLTAFCEGLPWGFVLFAYVCAWSHRV